MTMAWTNLKIGKPFRGDGADVGLTNASRCGGSRLQLSQKRCECCRSPFRMDFDPRFAIEHPAPDVMLGRQLVDKRPKSDPLNNPLDRNPASDEFMSRVCVVHGEPIALQGT